MPIHQELTLIAALAGLVISVRGEHAVNPCARGASLHRAITAPSDGPSLRVKGLFGLQYLIERTPVAMMSPGSAETAEIGVIEEPRPNEDGRTPPPGRVPSSYTLSIDVGPETATALSAHSPAGMLADLVLLCGEEMVGLATWIGPAANRLDVSLIPSRETARAVAWSVSRQVSEPSEPAVISATGVGDLRLGDTLANLVEALHSCDLRLRLARSGGGKAVIVMADCGTRLMLAARLDAEARITEIEVTGGRARTANGYKIGDPLDHLIRAMGEPAVHPITGRMCFDFPGLDGVAFCVGEGESSDTPGNQGPLEQVSPEARVTGIWVHGGRTAPGRSR